MAGIDFSVTVGGNNISSYVLSIDRTHDICQGTGGFGINLSSNFPHSPNPFDDVTIQEHGNTVFTGYVDAFAKTIEPAACKLEGTDVLKRARDYFISEPYISQGQTITYWVKFFLELCGLTNYNVENTTDIVPQNTEFNMEYILDILKKLCSAQGWVYYADGVGVVHVGDLMSIGEPTILVQEVDNLIHVVRNINDTWIRNKVIVWGHGDIMGVAEDVSNPYFDLNEVRVAALHSWWFESQQSAQDFSELLLDEFMEPLDLKECSIISDLNCPFIGDTVIVKETYTGLDHLCLVTGLKSTMSTAGAVVLVFLDAKCPAYWGWGEHPQLWGYNYYLCSMYIPYGVYKRSFDGSYWFPINNGLLGEELSVYNIGVAPWNPKEIWRVGFAGVYVSRNAGWSWTKLTMGDPLNFAGDSPAPTEGDLVWMDVGFDRFNEGTVYTLAFYVGLHGTRRGWLYKTTNGGISWENIQLRRLTG